MKHLFNQSATLYGAPTLNDFGEFTYSSGSSIKCRFELGKKIIMHGQGEDEVADAVLFTDTVCVVGGKVTYSSVDYRIIDVVTEVDKEGDVRFYQVSLQKLDA